MEWTSRAIVLSLKKHGEGHAVLEVLSREKGRARGYVKGGGSRRQRPALEPGNLVEVTWRGRLDEHLGSFRAEPVKAVAPLLFRSPARLAALNAVTGLLAASLPEREPALEIYTETLRLLEWLTDTGGDDVVWGAEVVRLEAMLLARLGYGLDLAQCAATGATENLAYVSPKTGRAVSKKAGAPYRERLLALPAFLTGAAAPSRADVASGFRLTGHFIERHLLHAPKPAWSAARERMTGFFRGK